MRRARSYCLCTTETPVLMMVVPLAEAASVPTDVNEQFYTWQRYTRRDSGMGAHCPEGKKTKRYDSHATKALTGCVASSNLSAHHNDYMKEMGRK